MIDLSKRARLTFNTELTKLCIVEPLIFDFRGTGLRSECKESRIVRGAGKPFLKLVENTFYCRFVHLNHR